MTRFRRFFQQRRRRAEEEVDDEISFHLEMKARDLIESGVPEHEAVERAWRVFGDSAAIRRECADLQRQVVRRTRRADAWGSISTDVRFALRALRGAPGFGALLILTLGLGIGASATVFSMLEALLVAPLPYPEHERLGFAFETREDEGLARDRISAPLYRELAALQESFESTAIFSNQGATLTGDQPAERVGVLRSTSGFFALLGAAPAAGRLLTPQDDEDGSLSVAILAHDLWQRRYGGDPGVGPEGLELEYEDRFFTLRFAALDYTDPSQNRYEYRLDPLDTEWRDAGNDPEAPYTSVPPDRYRFQVRARNSDGVWNEAGLEIPVWIRTPWWQTWQFRSAVMAAIVLAISALYRYRLQQIRSREALRLKIAGQLHDDIGANLSAMALKAEVARSSSARGKPNEKHLGDIARLARDTAHKVRETVWVVNTS